MKSDEILIKTFDQVKNDNFDQVKFDQLTPCRFAHFTQKSPTKQILYLETLPIIAQSF